MELAIPLVALGGLYIVSKNKNRPTNVEPSQENFQGIGAGKQTNELPNTNLPNKNYPEEYPVNPTTQEIDLSSKLSTTYKYDGQSVYTDKYFSQDTYREPAGETFTSMTGETVNNDYFSHNNMTPYFGAKNRSNILESDATEGILDSYTGAGTQIINKTEQSPLFSPGESYHFPNGAPNQNDFYQSRVNQSMRMANTKPFESEMVGPGLGLGNSNEGQGGYNSGMAMRETWMPKTVDELRTDNNQRAGGIGLYGHEGPALSSIKTLGSVGKVEKNRVERAWEHSPDRYFTTTGAQKGQTLHAIPIDRDVSRPETSVSYSGVASSQLPETYTTGEYMESKHMDLGPVPIGIASATGQKEATTGDYGIQGKRAYPNNRTSTGDETYFGAFSGAIGAVVAPLLDELRPSRKQNVVGTMRPYQNAQSKVGSSYLFNPADRPAPTIKETTEKNNFVSGVNKNQNGGAYMTTEHQAVRNERDTTSVSYAGGVSSTGRSKAVMTYDSAYRQRNNDIKSSTIKGHMVPGHTNVLNTDINQRNREGEIRNTRAVSKTNAPKQFFSPEMMGGAHSKQDYNSHIQLERNTPDMLDAFRKNPYTHSLTNIP